MNGPEDRVAESQARAAVAELQGIILAHHPDAVFDVFGGGEDPDGMYPSATVDVAETDEVSALYTDRLVDLQVHEGLPIYVLPLRPIARVSAELREERAAGAAALSAS